MTLSESDNGRLVRLHRQDTLVITLASEEAVGPHWVLVQPPEPNLLSLASSESVPHNGDAPPRDIFTFDVRERGSGSLRLDYKEPGVPAVRSFAVRFTVD